MSSKRKITGSTDVPHKRQKFTLEDVKRPETSSKGVVLVTGAGDVGQLGLGPDVLEKTRPATVNLNHEITEIVDICAGGMHSVCLTTEGKILTFGCNDEGALGRVTDGNEEAEFNAGVVDLPGKVVQVTAGDSHTVTLLEDGRVFAWGTFRDSHGNMGLSINGNERLPFEIKSENKIMKIASGADHIVLLTKVGEVFTFGCGEQGQLGRTSKRSSDRESRLGIGKGNLAKLLQPAPIHLKPSLRLHFDNIWATTYGTIAKVANKKDIYVCGLNNFHQIGLSSTDPEFLPQKSEEFSKYQWNHISGGQHHTLGLTTDGKVYVIGRKEYGRLGLGENCEDAKTLTEITSLADKQIVNVACGSATSFAVSAEGYLYSWGMGTNGQLGLGDEEDVWVPTQVKSKQLNDRKTLKVSSGGQHTLIMSSNPDRKQNGDASV